MSFWRGGVLPSPIQSSKFAVQRSMFSNVFMANTSAIKSHFPGFVTVTITQIAFSLRCISGPSTLSQMTFFPQICVHSLCTPIFEALNVWATTRVNSANTYAWSRSFALAKSLIGQDKKNWVRFEPLTERLNLYLLYLECFLMMHNDCWQAFVE